MEGDSMAARTRWQLLGVALPALLLLMGGAEAAGKIWRIGYLTPAEGPSKLTQAFLRRLQELGYVEGHNLVIEYRWAGGKNERLPDLAAELVRANVDVIVSGGTPATLAAKNATSTIPIVFSLAHPVNKGIIASLAHPGGNLTGIGLVSDHMKPLELLKEAAPAISQVAFLFDPATIPHLIGSEEWVLANQAQAQTLSIRLEPVALREAADTDRVFTTLPANTNGLLLENSAINSFAQDRICELARQHRLPAAGNDLGFARSGCLLSYAEDESSVYRRKAEYVDRILKGARPMDLPVEQPTEFDLIINLKTASELGLTIPWPLLARAEEVIE
jgi:putative ABC transport system substrate-binding protein